MTTRPCAAATVTTTGPSEHLRAAALAGLFCLATVACSYEKAPQEGEGRITSSENVGVLTEAEFTALCDERGGTVEVMPHCGGFATAKGFSYRTSRALYRVCVARRGPATPNACDELPQAGGAKREPAPQAALSGAVNSCQSARCGAATTGRW